MSAEPLFRRVLGDAFRFVKENTMCKVLSVKGRVFGIEPPNFVELVVTKSEPGAKGDTATNVTKPAIVETAPGYRRYLLTEDGISPRGVPILAFRTLLRS